MKWLTCRGTLLFFNYSSATVNFWLGKAQWLLPCFHNFVLKTAIASVNAAWRTLKTYMEFVDGIGFWLFVVYGPETLYEKKTNFSKRLEMETRKKLFPFSFSPPSSEGCTFWSKSLLLIWSAFAKKPYLLRQERIEKKKQRSSVLQKLRHSYRVPKSEFFLLVRGSNISRKLNKTYIGENLDFGGYNRIRAFVQIEGRIPSANVFFSVFKGPPIHSLRPKKCFFSGISHQTEPKSNAISQRHLEKFSYTLEKVQNR